MLPPAARLVSRPSLLALCTGICLQSNLSHGQSPPTEKLRYVLWPMYLQCDLNRRAKRLHPHPHPHYCDYRR